MGKIWHKIHACEIANEKQLREAEGFYTKVMRVLKFSQKDVIQQLVSIDYIGYFSTTKGPIKLTLMSNSKNFLITFEDRGLFSSF